MTDRANSKSDNAQGDNRPAYEAPQLTVLGAEGTQSGPVRLNNEDTINIDSSVATPS